MARDSPPTHTRALRAILEWRPTCGRTHPRVCGAVYNSPHALELVLIALGIGTGGDVITPRTKAIVPVHLAVWPVDMPALMDIARAHGVAVIDQHRSSTTRTGVEPHLRDARSGLS